MPVDDAVVRARLYIEVRHASIRSVAEIAGAVGVDYASLRKMFVRRTGVSLCEYLHRVRIVRVAELLGTNEKLYCIAQQVGYANEVALIRNWKKFFRLLPTEYRRKASAG